MDISNAGNTVAAGQRATWQATAPTGLLIRQVSIPAYVVSGVNDGNQYGGGFYWQNGGYAVQDGTWPAGFGGAEGTSGFPSPYFGFQMICGANPCTARGGYFTVVQAQLDVVETTGPTLTAGGLWAAPGWIRGDWPISVNGDSPSGICAVSAVLDGQTVASQTFPDDTAAWHQCNAEGAGGMGGTVHTTQFGNGPHQLTIDGSDAAGLSTSVGATIRIDNSTPVVTLSGVVTASSDAGTQYIAATAGASPSGIAEIDCSIDGAQATVYKSSEAQVAISGLGIHVVTCRAANNALDVSGAHAWSAPASWQLHIGQPTVSGLSFSKLVDALRCRRVRERVHHRGHAKLVKVTKCHARTTRRVVTVYRRVKRHGRVVVVKRRRIERVVVAPHVRNRSIEVVRYGQDAVVHGWLGTASGVALPGRPVVVMTAVDDGRGAWRPVGGVTTGTDGSWSARLPRGPSRLVQAVYAGDPTTLGSSSATVRLAVPARITLRISPRATGWGGRLKISGRVFGGYIPKGKLLRLRIGVEGVRGTVGIPSIRSKGRFHTTWTFSAGHGVVHYWFSVSTLNEADYPFAPGSSKRVYVTVGPG